MRRAVFKSSDHISIRMVLTAHGTMFALKGLIKGRGNAAVVTNVDL